MNVCPICRRALSDDVCPIDQIEAVEVDDRLLPPEVAEEFGIKGVYGAGDMGALYHVYDGYSSTWGLLKLMGLSANASDAGRQRLSRDLDRQLQMKGSGRLALARRAKVEGDRAWVFRPWIDGESLESRIFREDKLGLMLAMGIVAKIAQALDELHKAGLVHGSLHPGHVILIPSEDEVPDVALIDAGLVGDAQRGSAFDDLGDLFYMSPEQIKGKAWGFRSDLYSLGCVFYEMVNGEPPFDGDTAEGVMAAHQYQVPSIPDILPSSIAQLLSRMLAKVPSDRPMSTREIISTLKPYLSDIELDSSSQPPPARAKSAPPPRLSSAPTPRASSVPPAPPVPSARVSSVPPVPTVTARGSSVPPTPPRSSSAPPPAMSLAEIAAQARASHALPVTTLPESEMEPDPEPAHRKRRDPSSIQVLVSDFADAVESTGTFVIQKTARLPWLSLGILIGVLTTAGTAYAMAMGGQFHLITNALSDYLAVPEENLVALSEEETTPPAHPVTEAAASEAPPAASTVVQAAATLDDDSETDSDADSATETDADSETETDSNSETDSETDSATETDADSDAEAADVPDEPHPTTEEEEAEAAAAAAREARRRRIRRRRIRRRRRARARRARARRRAAAMMSSGGLVDGLAL
jgi:serine/threonine-protein kinase